MGKGRRNLKSWLEVAPAPIIHPQKPSNSPSLETIVEEAAEEYEDVSDMISFFSSSSIDYGALRRKSHIVYGRS